MHAIVLHPIRTPSPESCNARSNTKNEATDLSALCWHNPININVFCIVLPQMCACNPPAFWFMGGMNCSLCDNDWTSYLALQHSMQCGMRVYCVACAHWLSSRSHRALIVLSLLAHRALFRSRQPMRSSVRLIAAKPLPPETLDLAQALDALEPRFLKQFTDNACSAC
jgi:hypothetical protein